MRSRITGGVSLRTLAFSLAVGVAIAAPAGCTKKEPEQSTYFQRTIAPILRVRTPSGKVAYPDIVVVCGPLVRDAEDNSTITNPLLVIEVLSHSTEAYDRGKKFAHYRSCPSFVEYVLVSSHGSPKIERFIKTDGVWTLANDAGPGQVQRLFSIDAALSVDTIYRGLVGEDGAMRVL
jgi:Uma2 family endonuclease